MAILQPSLQCLLNELLLHLKQERLFVLAEQAELQALNERVEEEIERLARLAWLSSQQRVNLNRLIVSRPDYTPSVCCQRANGLQLAQFVDAQKVLPYQEVIAYSEFLRSLRAVPELVAQCLVYGEKTPEGVLSIANVIQTLAIGIYGSLKLPADTLLVLQLLRHLAKLQLAPSDNPRRLLRPESCAFSRLYSLFHEGLFSAKLFLTAALQGPIMQLLIDVECFLDIDPDKAVVRFPPGERLKKFGDKATPEYAARFQQYRQLIVNSLVTVTNRFIVNLHESMYSFPKSVRWLVRHIAAMLYKAGNLNEKEVYTMCIDLIFTCFICPAIVHPEPYGICDAPISHIARHNLIQVAQILQMLALLKFQEAEAKVADLYSRFDRTIIPSLVDNLLRGLDSLDDGTLNDFNTEIEGVRRTGALMTEQDLHNLVSFFHGVHTSLNNMDQCQINEQASQSSSCSGSDGGQFGMLKDQLSMLLAALPATAVATAFDSSHKAETPSGSAAAMPSEGAFRKPSLLLKGVSKSRSNRASNSSNSSSNATDSDDANRRSNTSLSGGGGGANYHHSPQPAAAANPAADTSSLVLIIPFNFENNKYIGLLNEQRVLEMSAVQNVVHGLENVSLQNLAVDHDDVDDCDDVDKKRTRFSRSLDEGSIGNTSDNLEAISEAASNHSAASSSSDMENEDQNNDNNDNLSDMVSANVSGRGTPNISGRDTPSSQITEGDDGLAGGNGALLHAGHNHSRGQLEARPAFLQNPQPMMNKQIRSEIDDKFCKFEIKKLLEGDETISIISDTWSTDVLASDSENVEAMPERAATVTALLAHQLQLDVSETQSESAWSTDVLASDLERMTEVDTDDTASVADDTARSEAEEAATATSTSTAAVAAAAATAAPFLQQAETNAASVYLSQQQNVFLSSLQQSHSYRMEPVDPYGSQRGHWDEAPPAAAVSPVKAARRSGGEGVTTAAVYGKAPSQAADFIDNNANNIMQNSVIFRETTSHTVSNGVQQTVTRTQTIERTLRQTTQINGGNGGNGGGVGAPAAAAASSSSSSAIGDDLIDFGSPRRGQAPGKAAKTSPDVGAAAVAPAYLLVKQVGAQSPTGLTKYESGVRNSNVSLNSTSSNNSHHSHSSGGGGGGNSSSSSSETQNKTCQTNNSLSEQYSNSVVGAGGGAAILGASGSSQWPNNCSENSLNMVASSGSSPVAGCPVAPLAAPHSLTAGGNNNAAGQIINIINNNNNNNIHVPNGKIPGNSSGSSRSVKPSSSTGAIPKSISFDMTAEKGDRDLDDDQKNKRSFFGKLKMGFKGRRGKSLRGLVDDCSRYDHGDEPLRPRRFSDDPSSRAVATFATSNETSEDILAKYRRKTSTASSNTADSSFSNVKMGSGGKSVEREDERYSIDHNNIEASFAFSDAKKKLRLVLATADMQYLPWENLTNMENLVNPLVAFLQLQIAKAKNLKDWSQAARLAEALRCLRLFDDVGCIKLCHALKEDYRKRSVYTQYLVRCKQMLLSNIAYLKNLQSQVKSENDLSSSHLVSVCVNLFLERRDAKVITFCEEFKLLKMADEKTDLLESFLHALSGEMEKDNNWSGASKSQLDSACIDIERTVMSRVYLHALYPNGDGDISRDSVLCEHIKKLSRVVTPGHKDLLIHKDFQYECPWPSAQEALAAMAAYRTPRDKVRCVVRCATSVMDLLSLSSDRGVPTADDFTPVLVYVIIMANPQALLSTIQYVDSFYASQLRSEEQYYWTQFCAAVEFIKTMDYSD